MTHIAVIDIGKTNAKLALVDGAMLREIEVVTRPNTVLPGPPYPHFDVEGHWDFLCDALARFQTAHGIDAISVTTHGAAVALLQEDGSLAAPILDYEHSGPDRTATEYDALRPPFSETGSPRLAAGLNAGAQLHWQLATQPGLRARIAQIVTYPQYWSGRLTGVWSTDVTSLGCHTDLWSVHENRPSTLLADLGLSHTLAPTRLPSDVLGPILPEIAEKTGLPAGTPVICGIHDSNASLLPHLLSNKAPFSVVSTGTWVIAMGVGAEAQPLDPTQDTLVNVNALGDPVPSARFMGGREHDVLTQGELIDPTPADISEVLDGGMMLLPAVVPETGPFQGQHARWLGGEPPHGTGLRSAAIGFYLALVTGHCLRLIGHRGPIFVEGPFARNTCYLRMISAATQSPVHAMSSATGTSIGAALLVQASAPPPATKAAPITVQPDAALAAYAQRWKKQVGAA